MEIRIQIRNKVYSVSISYSTKWFKQKYLVCIEQDIAAMEAVYATMLWHS